MHLVPQGSAYLYLHGADGAPRDQSLFAIPLTYLRPDLARDTLRLIMRMTDSETGAIPYAFAGYGIHDGAGVHEHPSDLDLFFLLGLGEYLAATGDLAFLDSVEPYYPRGSRSGTVLDHVRTAFDHLPVMARSLFLGGRAACNIQAGMHIFARQEQVAGPWAYWKARLP